MTCKGQFVVVKSRLEHWDTWCMLFFSSRTWYTTGWNKHVIYNRYPHLRYLLYHHVFPNQTHDDITALSCMVAELLAGARFNSWKHIGSSVNTYEWWQAKQQTYQIYHLGMVSITHLWWFYGDGFLLVLPQSEFIFSNNWPLQHTTPAAATVAATTAIRTTTPFYFSGLDFPI